MTPLISVVVPVYNCASYVDAAVRSILRQSYRNIEVLVVDDGSTDDTLLRLRAIVDDRLTVIEGGENTGLPARLNELVDRSRGDFIARMDGDDVSFPERLEHQLEFLQSRSDVDVVACAMTIIDRNNKVVGRNKIRGTRHEEIVSTPWAGFHFNHATWLGRRDWFLRYRYREDAVRVEDDDLLLRAYRTSRFALIPDVLYAYRVDGLDLRQIITTRIHLVRTMLRACWRQRDIRFLLAVPGQTGRAAVDTVAITSGLGYGLLRHRSEPVTDAEKCRWEHVITSVLT